jgi:Family of unknown function (DUF5681)
MPFKKGQSGNPSGRPKINADVIALARQHTEVAMATLIEICKSKKATPGARVSAAEALLDRGYGKAPATLTVTTNDAQVLTREELVLIAAAGRMRAIAAPRCDGEASEVH